MNYIQFFAFFIFSFSLFSAGAGAYVVFLNMKKDNILNRPIFLGESLLIGSVFVIGELFSLSFLGLYNGICLWIVVGLDFCFLFIRDVRGMIKYLFGCKIKFNLSAVIFVFLICIFIIKNCYFLIDVDSLSTYLFTQKLWLNSGTSLIGSGLNDLRIFNTQFDAIPYALGISLFGAETLFPQLINLLWRVIAVLLVFGYMSYRLNCYYGLASAMFVIFNDHFFYSGANQWVVLNGVVISLLFAATYNLWEARKKGNEFRFVLAYFLLIQVMANKYYALLPAVFISFLGIIVQPSIIAQLKLIFKHKRYVYFLAFSLGAVSLWYLKNAIVTRDPFFPILAGHFKSLGWTIEQEKMFGKVFAGLKPLVIVKYLNFLFVWPGVNPAKYVIFSVSFFPLIILLNFLKSKKINMENITELCYWAGISILSVIGLCLASWQDPRPYRFPIGIFSITAVLFMRYILNDCFNIKKELFVAGIVIISAIPGYKIIFNNGDEFFKRPTLRENIGVITNKIHMEYIVKKHIPYLDGVLQDIEKNKDKVEKSAWEMEDNSNAFLLPLSLRPIINLWLSTTIHWDSYSNKDSILNDLSKHNIEWILKVGNGGKLLIIPAVEYANEAVKYNRYPKKVYFDYGFPEELTKIN